MTYGRSLFKSLRHLGIDPNKWQEFASDRLLWSAVLNLKRNLTVALQPDKPANGQPSKLVDRPQVHTHSYVTAGSEEYKRQQRLVDKLVAKYDSI